MSGRWHYPGQPVVYLSESPAAALLEVCAHTCVQDVPPDFTLLKIECPLLAVSTISASELPENWQTRLEITRELGTHWLRENAAVLVRVPSAIVPETANFLFNPLHRDAREFQIVQAFQYPFDVRLKQ